MLTYVCTFKFNQLLDIPNKFFNYNITLQYITNYSVTISLIAYKDNKNHMLLTNISLRYCHKTKLDQNCLLQLGQVRSITTFYISTTLYYLRLSLIKTYIMVISAWSKFQLGTFHIHLHILKNVFLILHTRASIYFHPSVAL